MLLIYLTIDLRYIHVSIFCNNVLLMVSFIVMLLIMYVCIHLFYMVKDVMVFHNVQRGASTNYFQM